MSGRRFEVCIDANNPDRLRPFWRLALGYVDAATDEGAVDLVHPDGQGPTVWFQRVPEVKTAKNRLHLDIEIPAAERLSLVQELVRVGGTVQAEHARFTVLADPEGNEVCLSDI